MKQLSRRQFLQGLAAGFAVASMPAAIAITERTAAATEILGAPGWGFTIVGGSGPIGDSLILRPPGASISLADIDTCSILCWPEPLDIGQLQSNGGLIRLIPWQPYRKQFESVLPSDIDAAYREAKRWRM